MIIDVSGEDNHASVVVMRDASLCWSTSKFQRCLRIKLILMGMSRKCPPDLLHVNVSSSLKLDRPPFHNTVGYYQEANESTTTTMPQIMHFPRIHIVTVAQGGSLVHQNSIYIFIIQASVVHALHGNFQ